MEPNSDRLSRIEGKIDLILYRLDEGDKDLNDHSKRIRKLEQFQAKMIGVALAGSAMISAFIVWLQGIFGSGS